jgi:hypothetical protein
MKEGEKWSFFTNAVSSKSNTAIAYICRLEHRDEYIYIYIYTHDQSIHVHASAVGQENRPSLNS